MKRLFFFLLMSTYCLSACATFKAFHDDDFENADRFFNEKKYSEAIPAYNKIARESAGSERGAHALFAAAFSRAYYDNPHKDYAQALQDFDEFLRLYPNNERTRDAQSWRYFLKTLIELRKENERLNKNIEQLKRLDVRHEERRKGK